MTRPTDGLGRISGLSRVSSWQLLQNPLQLPLKLALPLELQLELGSTLGTIQGVTRVRSGSVAEFPSCSSNQGDEQLNSSNAKSRPFHCFIGRIRVRSRDLLFR